MVLVACLLCKPCVSCEGKEESRQRKPPTAGFKPHAPRDDAPSPTGGLSWQRLGAGAREGGRGRASKIIGHSGTCIWLDGHDSWHQEGKIQPNSNAGHVWGSSRKFLWVESMGIITMNSVHQDMGSVKWLGSLLATSHWKQLFHHHDCSKLGGGGDVSLQSAPEPTRKASLTRLGGENHEEPPGFVSDQLQNPPPISCHREERAWPDDMT
ncbi:unnamed protein product [Musa hybrid cultivar]